MRRSPTAPYARTIFKWSLYLAVGVAGIFNMFHPTIRSNFTRVQAEPVDTRLNHYFLEHSFQWVANEDYTFGLWSPPFFYPEENVLALSDNLLGTAPLYWLNRCMSEPTLGYQLWLIQVTFLTFLATVYAFRCLGVGVFLSCLSAWLFAFGLPRIAQIGHPQLLVQFYTPLALVFYFRFIHRPSIRALVGLCSFFFLQLAAGIYLAWFLVLGLMLSTVAAVGVDWSFLNRMWVFFKRRLPATGVILSITGLICFLFLRPYLEMSGQLEGGWSYGTVKNFLYPPHAWFVPSHTSFLHRSWAPHIYIDGLAEGSHSLGVSGSIFFLAGLVGCIGCKCEPVRKIRIQVCFIATVAGILLMMPLHPSFSLWKIVYDLIPGAGAIRALNRFWVVVTFFMLLAGALSLEIIFERKKWWIRVVVGILFAGVVVLENIQTFIPSFDPDPYIAKEIIIKKHIRDWRAAYVVPSSPDTAGPDTLTFMWAGLMARVPVVNGASSRAPVGYPSNIFEPSPEDLRNWLRRHGETDHGVIMVQPGTEIEDVVSKPLESL